MRIGAEHILARANVPWAAASVRTDGSQLPAQKMTLRPSLTAWVIVTLNGCDSRFVQSSRVVFRAAVLYCPWIDQHPWAGPPGA